MHARSVPRSLRRVFIDTRNALTPSLFYLDESNEAAQGDVAGTGLRLWCPPWTGPRGAAISPDAICLARHEGSENMIVTSGGRTSEERRSKARVTNREDSPLEFEDGRGYEEEKEFRLKI